jgi:hypothetical protein
MLLVQGGGGTKVLLLIVDGGIGIDLLHLVPTRYVGLLNSIPQVDSLYVVR